MSRPSWPNSAGSEKFAMTIVATNVSAFETTIPIPWMPE